MEILKRPLITEKATSCNERSLYGFIVDPRANKIEIKKAVESMYKVHVLTVNTMRYAGKKKTRHTKSGTQTGRKSSFKKAFVGLKEGEIIDFYSNI